MDAHVGAAGLLRGDAVAVAEGVVGTVGGAGQDRLGLGRVGAGEVGAGQPQVAQGDGGRRVAGAGVALEDPARRVEGGARRSLRGQRHGRGARHGRSRDRHPAAVPALVTTVGAAARGSGRDGRTRASAVAVLVRKDSRTSMERT